MFNKKVNLSKWPYRIVFSRINTLTLIGLAATQLSLLFTAHGQYLFACSLIFLQIMIDVVDGHMARSLSLETDIGMQLDSFSDFTSIIAIAVLIYDCNKQSAFLAIFILIFVLCAAIRLSVFNTV